MSESGSVIWSVPIRVIHWTLALIVLLDAFIVEEGDAAHRWWGYAAVVLVLVRFVYGFTGNQYERFSGMSLTPKSLFLYLRHHFTGKAHFEGHNPLASFVYIMIWLLIIGLAVTGWMLGLDAYWGDEEVENLHSWMNDGLLVLVGLHLVGITLDALIYRRKSWMGMIDGKRK